MAAPIHFFYTPCTTTCFTDARMDLNLYSIVCPLGGVTFLWTKLARNHVFISLGKNQSVRLCTYAYTEQTAVWCNMKARVVFILLSFERKKKRKIDIKIKNALFFIKSKLPGVSNCKHIHSCVTLTFLNFNI